MSDKPVGVSFLICTYNSVSRIGETLRCLAQQVVTTAIAWEVVLVDNACTDGTTPEAEARWQQLGSPAPLRTFKEPRPGKNFAAEQAFREARYRYACIVDDDNRLNPDYLQVGYDLLEAHPQVGILGGQNTGAFESPPPTWFSMFQHCYAVGQPIDFDGGFKPLTDGSTGHSMLWGAGMFVRTDLWDRLAELEFKSLFRGRQGTKNLTSGEDYELCYVALMLGYEIWYSSKLQLQHLMTTSRLTAEYRNKLFYSEVWGETRKSAYKYALWGKPGKNPVALTNLAKDFAYMGRDLLHQVASARYIQALLGKNPLLLMDINRQLLVLYDFVRNFRNTRKYHQTVTAFKHRIAVSSDQEHTLVKHNWES